MSRGWITVRYMQVCRSYTVYIIIVPAVCFNQGKCRKCNQKRKSVTNIYLCNTKTKENPKAMNLLTNTSLNVSYNEQLATLCHLFWIKCNDSVCAPVTVTSEKGKKV